MPQQAASKTTTAASGPAEDATWKACTYKDEDTPTDVPWIYSLPARTEKLIAQASKPKASPLLAAKQE